MDFLNLVGQLFVLLYSCLLYTSWKNKKTCPEESIYQLGTIDEHASVELLVLVFDEFKKEFDERFGSNVHIIDWSLHMDEATPHIHERHVLDVYKRQIFLLEDTM